MTQMNLPTKQTETRRTDCGCRGGGGVEEGGIGGLGISGSNLLYKRQTNKKVLLYGTGKGTILNILW